jgi:hypothetical protein
MELLQQPANRTHNPQLLYIVIYSTNIPPIMITNMIYETQNLLSL